MNYGNECCTNCKFWDDYHDDEDDKPRLIIILLLIPVCALAYTDDYRIEKDDNYYQYFYDNPDQIGIMQREEARLNNMMMRELRETDGIKRKNNAELECIRKGDDYDVCRRKYGY